ncbi:MAG: endo-1,4-beta-xylanase [Mariniblastus sp.]|nr:endo-1,4-beta-xylanase [Mariniblastus sp.]
MNYKISNVTVFLFLVSIPVMTFGQYDGRDQNAAWRTQAAEQIDEHRKADLNVSVQWADGTAVEGASVSISMKRHAFQFGSAVDPRYFLESRSEYSAGYAEKIEELFTASTLENHLKWRPWAGNWGSGFSQEVTQAGLDWLQSRSIATRGHAMMWPRYQSVPNSVRDLLDIENPTQQNLQDLYDATFDHIADIGSAVQGKIDAWDMLNEPRTSNDIEDKLIGFTPTGGPTISGRTDLRNRWFEAAQVADTEAGMFLNDYAILAGGDDLNNNIRTKYRQNLSELVDAGTPIDGLGFQSHFNETNRPLTSPSEIWELLDEFQNDYDLPVHITEFDYNTTDKQLQADYTRDFMTAVFAHESVDAFVLWGFWEGKINHSEAALFDNDFNANLNGVEYLDLLFNQWWTDTDGLSTVEGDFGTRGFLGDYEVVVDYKGQSFQFTTSLDANGLDFIAAIPEPGTGLVLTFMGLLCLGTGGRRRLKGLA